jgi:quinolinate synthase
MQCSGHRNVPAEMRKIMNQIEEIKRLKEEKDAVILAHYYVEGKVQEIADYVGDSYALSKLATTLSAKNIIFCGVKFMGESAKILNAQKNVVMADDSADCPMAHMVDIETIEKVRSENPDVCVVCYVNSTAEIKSHSDVCVTSSNAIRIVKALPNQKIFFIPDNNLGHYVSTKVPEKDFIFHDGFCHVHKSINKESVLAAKKEHPDALVLTHPECTFDVLEISDFIGSTSEIIDYAVASEKNNFIICTEMGVIYELGQKNPDKKFYPVSPNQLCPDMKRITLDKVLTALKTLDHEVTLDDGLASKANIPLSRMLELAK